MRLSFSLHQRTTKFPRLLFPSSLIIQFEFVRACSLMRWPSGLDYKPVWVAWMLGGAGAAVCEEMG